MITQDALRFYKSHSVYDSFGGIVLDRQEGVRIAKALGAGKACILQNHGLLTVGESVDEAAFWFISLENSCRAQLLVDAAEAGSGHKKILIGDEEAAFTYEQVGGRIVPFIILGCFERDFRILRIPCMLTDWFRSEEGLVGFPGVLRPAACEDWWKLSEVAEMGWKRNDCGQGLETVVTL
jgi:hypothetical protein